MSNSTKQLTDANLPVTTDWNGVIAELFDIERTYLQDSPSQDSSSGIASDDHNTVSATSRSSPIYDFIEQNVECTRSRSKHSDRRRPTAGDRQTSGYAGSSGLSGHKDAVQCSGYDSDYVDLADISRRENLACRGRHVYRETDLDDPWSDCRFVGPPERVVHGEICRRTPPAAYTSRGRRTPAGTCPDNRTRTQPKAYRTETSPARVGGRNGSTRHHPTTTTDGRCGAVTSSSVEAIHGRNEPTMCYFDIVPDDLLLRIFRYLSSDQLCRNGRVCLRWYNLAWDPILWTSVRINDPTVDADLALRTLTRRLSYETPTVCAIVETIDVSGCEKLTDGGLYTIARLCPDLRHLDISGCPNVSNIALFEVVSNCVNLEHLNVAGCVCITCVCLTPEATLQAASYGKQVYLHHLDMSDCHQLDDSGLQLITAYCNRLTNVYLRRCHRLTDLGVQYLANYCTGLRELSISDCPNVGDFGLGELAKLGANLRYLSVARCAEVTDVGVRRLAARCTRLRYLNVRGCRAVSDDSVDALARCCPRLRSVDLGKCRLTDDGLRSLARCGRRLRKLSVKGCDGVTDAGIVDVATHCPDLQLLNIQDCNVTIDAYRTVKRHCKHCVIEHTNPAFY